MSAEKLNINEWAEEDRPREKLARLGAGALTNAELLAILIGSGNAEETAVGLMQRVLNGCKNNLNSLGKLSLHELESYNGIGPAKAITILAACELGRRRQMEPAEEKPVLNSAEAIYKYFGPTIKELPYEEGHVLLLNRSLHLIKNVCISRGGLSETAVDVRLVIREALLANSSVIVFCHNHPSGSLRPSREDDSLTERIAKACDTMRITLLDHVIIIDGGFYSYSDEGKL